MLQRLSPFGSMRRYEDAVDRLWRNWGLPTMEHTEMETWTMPLDVIREDDKMVVKASVPGIKKEEIKVGIEDNVLTIRGETKETKEEQRGDYMMRERCTGSFYRSVRLPDSADADRAESSLEDGVLTVEIPMKESAKPKQIEVKSK